MKFHLCFLRHQPVNIDANSVGCKDGPRRILPQQPRLRRRLPHRLQGRSQLSHWVANTPQFIQVLVKSNCYKSENIERGDLSMKLAGNQVHHKLVCSSLICSCESSYNSLEACGQLLPGRGQFESSEEKSVLPCRWVDRAEHKLFQPNVETHFSKKLLTG